MWVAAIIRKPLLALMESRQTTPPSRGRVCPASRRQDVPEAVHRRDFELAAENTDTNPLNHMGGRVLDLALGEILKLAAGGVEGVANSHINIVVGTP
jgi:hypothetical protein